MPHTCSSVLVRCIDFRLGSAIRDYLNTNNLYDDIDIISIAGAVKNVNDEPSGFLAEQLSISKRLHHVQTIILMNHTDCGAYGGRSAFANKESEWKAHTAQLHAAHATITKMWPDVNVKLFMADVEEGRRVEIREVA